MPAHTVNIANLSDHVDAAARWFFEEEDPTEKIRGWNPRYTSATEVGVYTNMCYLNDPPLEYTMKVKNPVSADDLAKFVREVEAAYEAMKKGPADGKTIDTATDVSTLATSQSGASV